jgi:acetyltransferase-like isoleucine patch superfamily enzyme
MLVLETIREWKGVKVTLYPVSWIHDSAIIGEGTKTGAFVDISENVIIGKGNNIQSHITIPSGSKIGDGNFFGPACHLLNDKFINSVLQAPVVGNHNRIGGSVLILPGVRIGDNCFIGAGAMITRDVPSGTEILPGKGKKERIVW